MSERRAKKVRREARRYIQENPEYVAVWFKRQIQAWPLRYRLWHIVEVLLAPELRAGTEWYFGLYDRLRAALTSRLETWRRP